MMQRNANRLLRLINQLLDLSKLDAGKLTLQASYGNVIPFLKGLVFSFESLAASRNIDLHFEAPGGEMMLYFDRDKMVKIITNLLSNAFKFSKKGGIVTVTVGSRAGRKGSRGGWENLFETTSAPQHPRAAAPFLQVSISDAGKGIPADRLPHIFERFYQAGDSHAKSSKQMSAPATFR